MIRRIATLFLALTTLPLVANAAKTVKCEETTVVNIFVRPQTGTRINFPVKPEDVVFGGSGMFSVKYVKNDVHVSPLSAGASTNMTVYFLGRVCTFKISASQSRQDEIVVVRDSEQNKLKVDLK